MATSAEPITIMLVDDDENIRALVHQVLVSRGYHVLEACDGLEALETASEYVEPIHLLLTDVIMPKLSGIGLAERLLQQRPEMALVFMSGGIEATLLRGKYPKTLFLQKPFRAGHLVDAVRTALASVSSQP